MIQKFCQRVIQVRLGILLLSSDFRTWIPWVDFVLMHAPLILVLARPVASSNKSHISWEDLDFRGVSEACLCQCVTHLLTVLICARHNRLAIFCQSQTQLEETRSKLLLTSFGLSNLCICKQEIAYFAVKLLKTGRRSDSATESLIWCHLWSFNKDIQITGLLFGQGTCWLRVAGANVNRSGRYLVGWTQQRGLC